MARAAFCRYGTVDLKTVQGVSFWISGFTRASRLLTAGGRAPADARRRLGRRSCSTLGRQRVARKFGLATRCGIWRSGSKKALLSGEDLIAEMLDYKKCFGLLPHGVLLAVLEQLGLAVEVLGSLRHIFFGRRRLKRRSEKTEVARSKRKH